MFRNNWQVRARLSQKSGSFWGRICLELIIFPAWGGRGIKSMWMGLGADPLQMRPRQESRCPVIDACACWYASTPSRQQRPEIADHHSSKWSDHYYSCLRRFSSTMAWKPSQVTSANSARQVWRSKTVSLFIYLKPPFYSTIKVASPLTFETIVKSVSLKKGNTDSAHLSVNCNEWGRFIHIKGH